MTAVEALARAEWAEEGLGYWNGALASDRKMYLLSAGRVVERLRAMGFEIVPIDKAKADSFSPTRLGGKAIALTAKRSRVVVVTKDRRAMLAAAGDKGERGS